MSEHESDGGPVMIFSATEATGGCGEGAVDAR